MSKQNLSNYIKFLNHLTELEQKGLLTSKQKHLLKINLTTKEQTLDKLICSFEDEVNYQNSILQYLSAIEPQTKQKCHSAGENEAQLKFRKRHNSHSRVTTFNESKLIANLDELNDQLMNVWQSDAQFLFNQEINEKLRKVGELINKTTTSTPLGSQKQVNSTNETRILTDGLRSLYKDMKQHFNDYLRCHILLMDDQLTTEHLYKVLRAFMKNLVDADEVTFIINNELYTSRTEQFQDIIITEQQQQEIDLIQDKQLIDLSQCYPELGVLFQTNQYKGNYALKISNSSCIFCFHQKREKNIIIDSFLSLCNEYQFFEEVNQLAYFLLETLKQARVQCFNPLYSRFKQMNELKMCTKQAILELPLQDALNIYSFKKLLRCSKIDIRYLKRAIHFQVTHLSLNLISETPQI